MRLEKRFLAPDQKSALIISVELTYDIDWNATIDDVEVLCYDEDGDLVDLTAVYEKHFPTVISDIDWEDIYQYRMDENLEETGHD